MANAISAWRNLFDTLFSLSVQMFGFPLKAAAYGTRREQGTGAWLTAAGCKLSGLDVSTWGRYAMFMTLPMRLMLIFTLVLSLSYCDRAYKKARLEVTHAGLRADAPSPPERGNGQFDDASFDPSGRWLLTHVAFEGLRLDSHDPVPRRSFETCTATSGTSFNPTTRSQAHDAQPPR